MSVDLTMSVKTMARWPVGASVLVVEAEVVVEIVVLGLGVALLEGVKGVLTTWLEEEEDVEA